MNLLPYELISQYSISFPRKRRSIRLFSSYRVIFKNLCVNKIRGDNTGDNNIPVHSVDDFRIKNRVYLPILRN